MSTIKPWNEKSTAALIAAYKGKQDNDRLAKIGEQFDNRTAQQIRGKLVSEGVYEASDKKAVGGASQVRKAEIRQAIETLTSLPKNSLESLDKASKADLQQLSEALTRMSDQFNANNDLNATDDTENIA